jgi:uncharacterized membrane protein YheB (UPF0754 family)
MTVILWLIPPVAALIGWLVSSMAVRALFYPRQPKKALGLTFYGIFPKRQQQFAEALGKLVSQELLSMADMESKITSPENVQKLMPMVEAHMDGFLRTKLPQEMPMIGMLIGEKTIGQLKKVFSAELEILFPQVMKGYMANLQADFDLEKIASEKLASFPADKLKRILNTAFAKELRFVRIMGAVLGFIIGLVQVLLAIWL